MTDTSLMDPRDAIETMRAFDDIKTTNQQVVPSGGGFSQGQMTITDGVITAQKVAVERDERKVLQKISALAAMAGDDWFYRFPVKNKNGKQDFIMGPSIKCANNVARLYGNCQVDVRVVDAGQTWVIYAKFVDYETGFSLTRPFSQDKDASKMGGDPARKRDIAFQIGVSKAIRNVVCNALETHTTFAFEEAQKNLVQKVGANLAHYRERVQARLVDMGVALKRVEMMVGRKIDAWLAPDVSRIIAEIKAVGDGMATAEETWPLEAPPEPRRSDFTDVGGTVAEPPKTAPAAPPAKAEPPVAPVPPAEPTPAPPAAKTDAPMAKVWTIPGNVVGQDAIFKALADMIAMAETTEDLMEIDRQNETRIAKFSPTKRGELHQLTKAQFQHLTGEAT